ncbi:WD40 repeat containing protein [Nitrosotalea devaniterrae]|uniref:WD40 repeat containing protein n=1 Tax=Nitrosotalea devaniterrae TaxID=1078905 RepID=A0A128A1X6_9ARCH|nr:WD40 repeat containing protein [Candidatus Nitrosotalea devanaterra]
MKTLYYTIIAISGIAIVGGIALVLASEIDSAKLVSQNNMTENNYQNTIVNNSQSVTDSSTNQTYHPVMAQSSNSTFRVSQATTTLWDYVSDGQIRSVAISSDGKYIVAGSESDQNAGTVYFLDNQGNLLWHHTTDRKISQVFISSDNSFVLASGYQIAPGPAGIYENGAIYFFDNTGKVLWSYMTKNFGQILLASLSPDGSHVVTASGTELSYLDNSGKMLWNYTSSSDINSISFSDDSSNILTTAGHQIKYFDKEGKLLWTFDTDYGYVYAKLSPDGKYVVAGDAQNGYDGKIYFIDNTGHLIKESQVGSPIGSISISADSSHVAIGTNWATMLFTSTGDLIWTDKIVSQVAISSDGSFIAGVSGAGDGTYLTYFDKHGNILSRYPIGDWAQLVLSKDSQYAVLGHPTNYLSSIQFVKVPSSYAAGLGISDIPQFDLQHLQTSNDTHVSMTSVNNTELYAQVATGQTVQLPYNLNFETNFTSSDLQLGLYAPEHLDVSVSPVFPTEIINGVLPGSKILTIHADTHATPGNYTITVYGKGSTVDSDTGWLTTFDNVVLAKVHVTVKPYSSKISIHVGDAQYVSKSFCVNLEPDGQSCGSGPIYERVPITVYSNSVQTVTLNTSELDDGKWVKFVPDKLVAGPDGTISTMIVSGYEIPFAPNPLNDKSLVIQAASENDTQTVIVPVYLLNFISVLHSPSPIHLSGIATSSNGTNFSESGVVYDPLANSNGTLPVKLAVRDLLDGNLPISLPLWLSIDVPNPEFALNATEPYYFIVTAKTHDGPSSGTYTVEIDEDIGGQHFVQPETIVIENIRH